MHEFGTALRDEVSAVLLLQTLHVGDVAEEHRALPARIDLARARNGVFLDVLEQFRDAAVGRIFVVVRPVRGENLVGLAAEEEIELLLEDAVELFAKLLIEIGHLPAAELEALGRILRWPAGRLHDAVHGNHCADDYLPHGPLSLFEPRTNGPLPIRHVPTLTSWRAVRCKQGGACRSILTLSSLAPGPPGGARATRRPSSRGQAQEKRAGGRTRAAVDL